MDLRERVQKDSEGDVQTSAVARIHGKSGKGSPAQTTPPHMAMAPVVASGMKSLQRGHKKSRLMFHAPVRHTSVGRDGQE